jgi:hypothetical protein
MEAVMSFNLCTRDVALAVAALALVVVATPAKATQVFYDNFGTENGGVGQLNYGSVITDGSAGGYGSGGSFANWVVGRSTFSTSNNQGSVDLIGNGFYDLYPNHGLYVDMCGSTSACGSLKTRKEFGPGTYTVSISYGGPARGLGPDGLDVNFGGHNADTLLLANISTGVFKETVTLANAGYLTISDLNTNHNENQGAILFSAGVSAVPIPGSLVMFGTLIVGMMGFAGFRRKLGFSHAAPSTSR